MVLEKEDAGDQVGRGKQEGILANDGMSIRLWAGKSGRRSDEEAVRCSKFTENVDEERDVDMRHLHGPELLKVKLSGRRA